jgi:site-specific DNA-methyltransferase (adenine-specific)
LTKKLLGSLELNRIYQRDCLEGMTMIPDKSIDMILCDLPYGTTACKWDTVIPFEPLWEQYERIIKDNGAIVLTASQPFTSFLVTSNPKWFRHSWVWNKKKSSGALNANVAPLKIHEDVLVFGKKKVTYNKQLRAGKPRTDKPSLIPNGDIRHDKSTVLRGYKNEEGLYNPVSIIEFSNAIQKGKVHPTQKPVSLFEYLIKTYSNEGDIVLDNCMGSGTTAVAAARLNRNFIGFEREPAYVEIANKRIDSELEAN